MKKNAFTLVELLVVISIMSILTMITVSQFTSARIRSRDVARKADLNSLSKALQNYYADYGLFPDQDEIVWGGEFSDATGYVYMKVVPRENTTEMSEYCYEVSGDSDMFALYSELENEDDEEYNKWNGVDVSYSCLGTDYNYAIYSSNAGYGDL